MAEFTKDTLTLNGHEIEVRVGKMKQSELNFYLDNPRLYSIVRANNQEPSQEEIFEILSKKEHVKALVQQIKANGGLIDPVVVQAGKNVVLEGNSRLAAYRILFEKSPAEWAYIKVHVLPEDLSDELIFSLLGEYHINGKTDWEPFEQAGFMYRRHKLQEVGVDEIAKSLNSTRQFVAQKIKVYEFMQQYDELEQGKWSYYDEYLKSNKIEKLRKEYGKDFDNLIVNKIKSGEIKAAIDIREKLQKISDAGPKIISNFVLGKIDFEDSYNAAIQKGVAIVAVKKIKEFASWLAEDKTKEELSELAGDPLGATLQNVKNIKKRIDKIEEELLKLKNNLGKV